MVLSTHELGYISIEVNKSWDGKMLSMESKLYNKYKCLNKLQRYYQVIYITTVVTAICRTNHKDVAKILVRIKRKTEKLVEEMKQQANNFYYFLTNIQLTYQQIKKVHR